jgi:hypothetical protein
MIPVPAAQEGNTRGAADFTKRSSQRSSPEAYAAVDGTGVATDGSSSGLQPEGENGSSGAFPEGFNDVHDATDARIAISIDSP